MYEHRKKRPLNSSEFARRIAIHLLVSLGVIAIALGIGVLGYHFLGGFAWTDALLNASMILGGMGPVDPLQSDAAKYFASFYALFSGLAFIGIMVLMITPFVHRILHRFHREE